MKLTTFFLSSALLLSTVGVAAAAPGQGPAHKERPALRDQRDFRRPAPRPVAWESLGTFAVQKNRTRLELERRNERVDALKLSVARGNVHVKKVIVTFADGSRYVAKVDARFGVNATRVIDLPGAAKKVASIELRTSGSRRAQIQILAR